MSDTTAIVVTPATLKPAERNRLMMNELFALVQFSTQEYMEVVAARPANQEKKLRYSIAYHLSGEAEAEIDEAVSGIVVGKYHYQSLEHLLSFQVQHGWLITRINHTLLEQGKDALVYHANCFQRPIPLNEQTLAVVKAYEPHTAKHWEEGSHTFMLDRPAGSAEFLGWTMCPNYHWVNYVPVIGGAR